jgi:hypothetical protein
VYEVHRGRESARDASTISGSLQSVAYFSPSLYNEGGHSTESVTVILILFHLKSMQLADHAHLGCQSNDCWSRLLMGCQCNGCSSRPLLAYRCRRYPHLRHHELDEEQKQFRSEVKGREGSRAEYRPQTQSYAS